MQYRAQLVNTDYINGDYYLTYNIQIKRFGIWWTIKIIEDIESLAKVKVEMLLNKLNKY